MSCVSDVDDLTDIRQRFEKYDIRNSTTDSFPAGVLPHLKRASVLVPIFVQNGKWRILLTIRSDNLKNHTGTVAFPGGLCEKSDTDFVMTALREAEEEIGLRSEDVKVLAVLYPSFVRPLYLAFPVVAVIPNSFVPKPNHEEVAKVFDMPLDRFLEDTQMQNWNCLGVDVNLAHFPWLVDNVEVDIWGFTVFPCMITAYVVYNVDKTLQLLRRCSLSDDDIHSQWRFLLFYIYQHLTSKL